MSASRFPPPPLPDCLRPVLGAGGDVVALETDGPPERAFAAFQRSLRDLAPGGGPVFLVRAGADASKQSDEPAPVTLADGRLNAPYLLRNAEVLEAAREWTLARAIYRRLLDQKESPAAALLGLGRCAEGAGRDDEALAAYADSIAFEPSLHAYRAQAGVLRRQGKPAAAAETLARALRLPGLPLEARVEAHRACADAWRESGGLDDSERHLTSAVSLLESRPPTALPARVANRMLAELRLGLAEALEARGRKTEALAQIRAALALDADNAATQFAFGMRMVETGELLAAHDALARSLELELQNPAAVLNLLKCAFALKTYATAARLVEDYIRAAPVSASLLYSLAGLQFHLGRLADSAFTAGRILELQPAHAGARELLTLIERKSRPEAGTTTTP